MTAGLRSDTGPRSPVDRMDSDRVGPEFPMLAIVAAGVASPNGIVLASCPALPFSRVEASMA